MTDRGPILSITSRYSTKNDFEAVIVSKKSHLMLLIGQKIDQLYLLAHRVDVKIVCKVNGRLELVRYQKSVSEHYADTFTANIFQFGRFGINRLW